MLANIDKNGLQKQLSLFSLTNIVAANMIGAGIFTTSGLLMEKLGNPLIMLSLWLAGGLFALCGALSYGELGTAMPEAGGEYVFLSRLYHPLAGFLSGWVSILVGFSAPIAASAIGFSEYLAGAFPRLLPVDGAGVFWKKGMAILIILCFSLIHLLGLRIGTRIQNLLTLFTIGMIVSLVLMGFCTGKGDFRNLFTGSGFQFNFSGWKALGLSFMWITFAYSGWNASVYIGSEIKNPRRNLPLSLLLGTGLVTILYLFLNLFFIYAVSPQSMAGVIPVGSMAAQALFGPSVYRLFSMLIALTLISALSAFIILGPRVYFAMARSGHFFSMAAEINRKHRSPSTAIVFQGTIASIIVLSGTLEQILTYMGFSLGIFPILAVAGIFRMRRKRSHRGFSFGFPVVPALFVLTGSAILIFGFLESPIPSTVALLTVLAGIPVFFIFRHHSAGGLHPPVQTDDLRPCSQNRRQQ